MKKNIFLICLLMSAFLANSQNIGYVLDSDSIPINQVDIYFADQDILIQSNEEGIFYMNKEIPNNTYLHFRKFGYASRIIHFKENVPLVVILEKIHVKLDEVGVVESYNILGNSKFINIEKKSFDTDLLTSTSMVQNIAQLSGIDIISSGNGIQKFVVRGLSGMRVVTYLNGMRIENQQWANDHGVGFTDLGLYELELIKGSSALKYGAEAVGGLLYFKDNPFIESKGSGFISTKFDNSTHLFSNQLGFKYSKNNFFFNVYAQYLISSDYRLPNNTYLFNSRFRNRAIKFSIANRQNKWHNILRYQYNGETKGIPAHTHGDLEDVNIDDITNNSFHFDDFSVTRPTQFVNNHLFIYESNYFHSNSKFSFYLGQYMNNLKEYEKWSLIYPAFDMTLSQTQIRGSVRTNFDDLTLNIGAQAGNLKNENNIITFLVPDARMNDLGFYSTLDYDKEPFGLSVGARFDYKKIDAYEKDYQKSFPAISSSAGIYFKQARHFIRFTYSGAFRTPHLSELFVDGIHHGTNRYEIGDTTLSSERSHQFDFKYQWSNDHLGLVFNPFLHNIKDFISINPTDAFYQNTYRIYEYNQFSRVNLSGFEMNLHYHPHIIHNLHFEQSYTFINTKNYDNNTVLGLTPSNKIKTSVILDLREYNSRIKFQKFSLYYLHSFKQDNVVENEDITSSYNLFNVALNVNLFKKLNAVFGINNVLNVEYVPHLSRLKEVGGGVPNPGRSFNINLKYVF